MKKLSILAAILALFASASSFAAEATKTTVTCCVKEQCEEVESEQACKDKGGEVKQAEAASTEQAK